MISKSQSTMTREDALGNWKESQWPAMPWSRDKVELFSESASEFSVWSDDLDERGEISSGRTRRPWANCDPTPPKNGMLARRPAMVVVGQNEGPARGNLGEPATGVSGGELGVPIEVLMTGACDCLIVVVFSVRVGLRAGVLSWDYFLWGAKSRGGNMECGIAVCMLLRMGRKQ